MIQINPCGHRVLVKPEKVAEVDEVYKSARRAGIELIEDKREQEAVVIGTILKIGDTAWKDPSLGGTPWANVGDKVYYAKFSGKEIKIPGETPVLIMNDEDIVAVIKENN